MNIDVYQQLAVVTDANHSHCDTEGTQREIVRLLNEDPGTLSANAQQAIAIHLGDLLRCVALLADEAHFDLSTIAEGDLDRRSLASDSRGGIDEHQC
jgi:hypothetical protein